MTADEMIVELGKLRDEMKGQDIKEFDVIKMLQEGVLNYNEKQKLFDFDFDTKTLTINSDFRIKIKGDLYIEANKHIMVNSGQKKDPRRDDGLEYSVFLNSKVDKKGQPIVVKPKIKEGKTVLKSLRDVKLLPKRK